jgi:hypothetical protein
MMPPGVHTVSPRDGEVLDGRVIQFTGSMVDDLFAGQPPTVYDEVADRPVAASWRCRVAEVRGVPDHPPQGWTGGEMHTVVELTLDEVVPGHRYRVSYRSGWGRGQETIRVTAAGELSEADRAIWEARERAARRWWNRLRAWLRG